MVKVKDDGLFPVKRDKVWQLIAAHEKDFHVIHPAYKSRKLLRKEGNSDVIEFQVDMGGQLTKVVSKFTANPPGSLTIEFLQGPMTGKMVNSYTETAGKTKVDTVADMKSKVMDEKQLEAAVKDFLNNGFNEDLRYLKTMK